MLQGVPFQAKQFDNCTRPPEGNGGLGERPEILWSFCSQSSGWWLINNWGTRWLKQSSVHKNSGVVSSLQSFFFFLIIINDRDCDSDCAHDTITILIMIVMFWLFDLWPWCLFHHCHCHYCLNHYYNTYFLTSMLNISFYHYQCVLWPWLLIFVITYHAYLWLLLSTVTNSS